MSNRARRMAAFAQSFALFLFNILDAVTGFLTFFFGIFLWGALGDKTASSSKDGVWVIILPMTLGVLLMVAAALSFVGMAVYSCRKLLTYSSFLVIPVAIIELISGITFAARKKALWRWVISRQKELKISDALLDTMSSLWNYFEWGFFILFVLQLVRWRLSARLQYNLDQSVADLEEEFISEDAAEEERALRFKLLTHDKYEDLRRKYALQFALGENPPLPSQIARNPTASTSLRREYV